MTALLDTSLVIASDERGELDLPETAAISVITLGELRAGVLRARDAQVRAARARRLRSVRAAFAALPLDEEIAERYGEVLAAARDLGRTVKATDLIVIATAATTGRVLYTLDNAQAGLARELRVPVG
ncbi:MAG TPA: PIN domain-containing protein [Solirubrobacteraceae bacterium]